MSRIGIIGDTHLGAYEVNESFIQYQVNSLKWAYQELKRQGVKTVIFLGDFLDKRKYISLRTFQLLNTQCLDDGLEKIFICGNHETFYKDTNEVNAVNLILREKGYRVVDNLPEEIEIDGTPCLFIPWLNKGNIERSTEIIRNSRARFGFGHLELNNFELMRGLVCEHGQINLNDLGHFDILFSGHFHCTGEKGNIVYLGSLMELNWSDYAEKKRIAILDTESGDVEYIHNPYTIHEKLYVEKDFVCPDPDDYKNKIVKVYLNTKRTVKLERFINSVVEVAQDVTVIDNNIVMNHVDLNIDTQKLTITEIWEEYLKSQDIPDDDKQNIDRIFKKCYSDVMMEGE